MDLEAAEKLYVKEFAEVLFFSENNLILKGRIQKISYGTSYESTVSGFGMEALLLEKELIKSSDKRVQYTNTSAQTVANEILSSGTDGSAPWIIQPTTTGLFDTDYGNISIRYEYGNRLNSIAKLAEAIDYEWRVTQNDDFIDSFDLAPLLPDATSATVSQETFAITGASANCSQTSKNTDITNLANKIDALGYGDGVNQRHTSTYNASETYSTLASDITAASTTITLADASAFPSSGEIRIAEERITYSGKSSNDLTGCTRGTSSTTALVHKKNVYTEKYIAIDSAESGSSIGTNGLMDYTVIERDILDVSTLELIASRKLLERMNPIVRIGVIPNEPLETAGSRKIGDFITITDAESDISDDYRIVGMTYVSYYGDLSLELEASNKTLTFIEQMQKQREANENLSKYMQGSTNIYAINEAENCDATHYLNMRFYLPAEAISINKINVNFKMKDYRAYNSTNANESVHTHSVPSLVVSGDTSTSNWTYDNYALFHLSLNAARDSSGNMEWYQSTKSIGTAAPSVQSGGTWQQHVWLGSYWKNNDAGGTGTDKTLGFGTSAGGVEIYSTAQTVTAGSGYFITYNDSSNRSGNTIYFTVKDTSSGGNGADGPDTMDLFWHTYSSHTHAVSGQTTTANTSGAGSAHTHGITYGITEETLTSPSMDLYVGEDGGSMTQFNGSYTTDQTNLDITSLVSAVGAGKWINVQFRPSKKMRIEASTYVQIFIESK